MTELEVLQAIRLKGRVAVAALAETLRVRPADLATTIDELTGAGLVVSGDSVRLSEAGRTRCDELLAAERAGIDIDALAAAYQRFRAVNDDLKALVTDWQLNRDDRMSDRLESIHRTVLPVIAAAATQLPRLAGYADKLDTALARISAGDPGWLTRPMADSYHTVWFELHEELLRACGLTRCSDD
ncbi:MAG TPA: MarR family transcriptional regulator [Mycobacterium sp.]|nr:MarR family transcriptional regulator [Mycobacterium sp.]